ncbi:MAG: winged helix DNA-binding domain-containing protein [Verrucomicrobiota bacterium]
MTITTQDLIAMRMAALRLHEGVRATCVLELVRSMGALQAQDYESGLWAIGVRIQKVTRSDVEQSIAKREILRTWSMRGTWHFVPATDAAWMQQLMATRVMPSIIKRSADFGFDERQVSRARDIVISALSGGLSVARETLIDRMGSAGVNTFEQRGNHLVRRFGNEGLICNAVIEGKEPTFVLLNEWVPKPTLMDEEQALATLALLYFSSHGPATVNDFVWWTGLTKAHTQRAIQANGCKLKSAFCEDVEYWFAPEIEPLKPSDVELLPAFDEHLLGFKDRSHVLAPHHSESVCPGGNGVFRPTLVANGQVVGLWKRKETAKKVQLDLQPYTKLSSRITTAVAHASNRYADFLGKPVTTNSVA